MRLEIEKVAGGVRVLLDRPNTAPVEVVLPPAQVTLMIAVLEAAIAADKFKFALEV